MLQNTQVSQNTGTLGSGLYYEFAMATPHVNCHSANLKVKNSTFDGNTVILDASNSFNGYGVAVHLVTKYYNNRAIKISSEYYTEFTDCVFENSADVDTSDMIITINIVNMDVSITNCDILNNQLSGIGFSNSRVKVSGNILVRNNTGMNGGGMLFCESSYLVLTRNTTISFINNHAVQLGGGIYIEGGCLHCMSFCFYQPDYNEYWSCSNISKSITMINNTAGYAGDHIYGGKLDGCMFHNCTSSEVFQDLFTVDPYNPSAISSNPRKICFCNEELTPNCTTQTYSITDAIYPGEFIKVDMVTVGQFNGTVPGTVVYHTGNSDLKPEINYTQVNCITFNIEVHTSATEHINISLKLISNLYSPNINYRSVSKRISIPLKKCPPGFSHKNGICECEIRLHKHHKCFITNHTILRNPPAWIGYDNDLGLLYHSVCPNDYCSDYSVNITSTFDQDSQCAPNRTGLLCSMCKDGTTLSLGSSNCMKCQNKIALPTSILSYMLFGAILVLLLIAFNITYTGGMFSGLLFYANIVNLNDFIFFSRLIKVNTTLRVLISWMSLNPGFDSCMYDGMDTYAKAWMRFFFPNYLFFITAVIIFLCKKSERLARLFGENIVKVLATLFIVSYTKLIQSVVTVLSFTVIEYPSNTTSKGVNRIVWLSDPTLEYFSGKHIPLALVAIVFGLLILAFTMVLLCVQPLQRYSHLRCFSWMAKLKPLIDAYTAPHIINDNCRYWEGLLLFFCLMICAANTKSNVNTNLVAIVSICMLLLTIAWNVGGVYKKSLLNILNSSCILNLIVLTIALGLITHERRTAHNITAGAVLAYHIFLQAKSWYVICKRHRYGQHPEENSDNDLLANLREF